MLVLKYKTTQTDLLQYKPLKIVLNVLGKMFNVSLEYFCKYSVKYNMKLTKEAN